MDDKVLNERIKMVRSASTVTVREFAEKLGITEDSIKNIELKRTKVSGAILALLVERLEVNPVWLLTGEGHIFMNWTTDQKTLDAYRHLYQVSGKDISDHFQADEKKIKRAPMAHILECANMSDEVKDILNDIEHIDDLIEIDQAEDGPHAFMPKPYKDALKELINTAIQRTTRNGAPSAYLENDFVLVPHYDVTASAGHGAVIHSEQIVDHLAFKREWVRKDLGLNPDKLALINSVGDSMETTIFNNDLLLVDMASDTLSEDAIYVLYFNDALWVKRIQRLLNGSVVIKSDNPIYDTQTLQKEELSDLRVLGRVVWFGRYM